MLTYLKPYVAKYKRPSLLAPLTVTLEVLLEITIPFLMSLIVDVGITNRSLSYVFKVGAIMVVIALISMGFGFLSGKFAAEGAMGFGAELRRGVFSKVQDFSFANLDNFTTPSLITRLTTDITNVQTSYMMIIRVLVRAPIMLIAATIMSAFIEVHLVWIFMMAIPLLATMLILLARVAFKRFNIVMRRYDDLNAKTQENLMSMRVVKAFVREDFEREKFAIANNALMNASRRAEKIVVLNMPIMMVTIFSCIIAVLWFGGQMVMAETMLTGELISFLAYVGQILMSLMMIAQVFIQIVFSRSSLERILEILKEDIDITDEDADDALTVTQGSVEFKNVSFRYNKAAEDNILKNINLTINPGETVGIIGGTGAAKTSLVQLIPRLYDASDGELLVGGHDVRDYKLKTLRDQVSMVLQKNVLFSGSIKDNLRWGNETASDDQIIDCAKAAAAHDFIMAFPQGYDTRLGQGGAGVSGGQKQRLCIARALLKKPKILILDDSTSAVDTATDAMIRQGLKESAAGMTVIIIAQRLSSVADADKIVILDEGQIVATDTHDSLLAGNPIYQEIYHSQQKGSDD